MCVSAGIRIGQGLDNAVMMPLAQCCSWNKIAVNLYVRLNVVRVGRVIIRQRCRTDIRFIYHDAHYIIAGLRDEVALIVQIEGAVSGIIRIPIGTLDNKVALARDFKIQRISGSQRTASSKDVRIPEIIFQGQPLRVGAARVGLRARAALTVWLYGRKTRRCLI